MYIVYSYSYNLWHFQWHTRVSINTIFILIKFQSYHNHTVLFLNISVDVFNRFTSMYLKLWLSFPYNRLRLTRCAPNTLALKITIDLFTEPDFVGSYDIGQYVFFFFRETAVEYINCGKSIFSRVARVCKKDTGGKNILNHNWATYLKARLNCSIPGEYPFYFNEIRK